MSRFFIRLVAFMLPIIVILISLMGYALYRGEGLPFATAIRLQSQSQIPIVYHPSWSREQLIHYKLEGVSYYSPEVLMIGSSRVTWFRAALLNLAPNTFYNAGTPNMSLEEIYAFLQLIVNDRYTPNVLIIGIDVVEFNGDRVYRENPTLTSTPNLIDNYDWALNGFRVTALDTLNSYRYDTTILNIPDYRLLGLQVNELGRGYLWDGSRVYVPNMTNEIRETRMVQSFRRYENRTNVFGIGTTLDHSKLDTLNNILMLASENNISVIGYAPPFHTDVVDALYTHHDFSYFPIALQNITTLFDTYQYPFYDFTDPQTFGGSNDELSDIWHPSDLSNLRMYRHFLNNHTYLEAYSDSSVLDAWLHDYRNHRTDQFLVDLP